MLIHCFSDRVDGKQRLVAFDRTEGTAIYAHVAVYRRDAQGNNVAQIALTVGFTQPLSPVLRDKARRRAIERFVDDRRRFLKESQRLYVPPRTDDTLYEILIQH